MPQGFEGRLTHPTDFTFSETNGLGHVFSETGRHERTIDLETGAVLLEFLYDENGEIEEIVDRFGNTVSIQRDGEGQLEKIVAPDGTETAIAVVDDEITEVSYPDGGSYEFLYDSGGLMTHEKKPNGNWFFHEFDATGRVTNLHDLYPDEGGDGGDWEYARQVGYDGDVDTTVSTAEGQVTTYHQDRQGDGSVRTTVESPTGATSITEISKDGSRVEITDASDCAPEVTLRYGVDPVYRTEILQNMSVAAGDLSQSSAFTREYNILQDGTYDRVTYTQNTNGKVSIAETSLLPSQSKIVTSFSSPEGRSSITEYDFDHFLARQTTFPAVSGQTALYPVAYTYDLDDPNYTNARGQVTTVTVGTRGAEYTYYSDGRLESSTDTAGRAVFYHYDEVGRVERIVRPDSEDIIFQYDDGGRMTVLTTPKDIEHDFHSNRVDLPDVYDPPLSPAYAYAYDRDRRLTTITYPSGGEMVYAYEDGKLDTITLPSSEGTISMSYGDGACPDKLTGVTKGSESVAFAYDGLVLTGLTFDGAFDSTLGFGYLETPQNRDFLMDSLTYAGATEDFTYDDDNLLTGSSGFTIARESSTGFVDSVGDGTLLVEPTFNGFGEQSDSSLKIGGVSKASWGLTFDPYSAEITAKSETVAGTTTNYVYTYTNLGQLDTSTKSGSAFEDYGYDPNGNRTYQNVSGTERWLTYDDEDHLDKIFSDSAKTVQVADYNYDVDGFLTQEIDSAGTTSYDYDSQGELLAVDLPGGTDPDVAYDYDILGRRVTKKVNGTVTEKYLWAGMNQGLLAVYNSSDILVARFKYAGGRLPVSVVYSSATYYLVYDQVGSLRAIFNSSGTKVWEITYDSYGNILSESGSYTGQVPFGFAGGLHDRTTGLVLFGHRDYDPKTGRWTAKDPIGFAGGDVEMYGYATSNPVLLADPTGLLGAMINLGASASGIFHIGGGISFGFDTEGNVGFVETLSGGAAFNVSAGGEAGVTILGWDTTVPDLSGWSVSLFGEAGPDVVYATGKFTTSRTGNSATFGASFPGGFIPLAFGATVDRSWVQTANVFDVARQLRDKLKEIVDDAISKIPPFPSVEDIFPPFHPKWPCP